MDKEDQFNRLTNPKQPFFVLARNEYYKIPVMRFGISHFYCYRTDDRVNINEIIAVPDCCIDVLFYCGENGGKAFFFGTVLEPQNAIFEPDSYIFGVRFLPCYNPIPNDKGAYRDITQSHIVPFKDILPRGDIVDRITESTNIHEQSHIFMDAYLKAYLREYPTEKSSGGPLLLPQFLAQKIQEAGGSVLLEELAQQSGYSMRHLSKTFSEAYTFSPKTFARIMRFQTMLSVLCSSSAPDYSAAAMELGFSDQSHMIREFKSFVHLTPRKYVDTLSQSNYKDRLIIL